MIGQFELDRDATVEPVAAVAEYFGIKDKSAEYRIQQSRKKGFLEPVKKVSAKRQKVKKGKVNAKRKKK
jgi:hypothetical protein